MGPAGRGEPLHPGPPAPRGSGYGLLTPSGPPPNGTQANGSPVMMVYGLDKDKVNPDKLFNLFCLYGNVVKVRVVQLLTIGILFTNSNLKRDRKMVWDLFFYALLFFFMLYLSYFCRRIC